MLKQGMFVNAIFVRKFYKVIYERKCFLMDLQMVAQLLWGCYKLWGCYGWSIDL